MLNMIQVCADEKESRKDLYIKATSYSGQLKARKSSMLKVRPIPGMQVDQTRFNIDHN